MPTRYDRNPAEAEAAFKAAGDEYTRIESEIAALAGESERIEQEDWKAPEEAADIGRRVDAVQKKISDLQMDLRGADEYLSSTHDYWFEEEDDEEDDESSSETLSVSDAADIWLSNGMDEDNMFGYSEDELRRAADMD